MATGKPIGRPRKDGSPPQPKEDKPKGVDKELVAHLVNSPDEEFVRKKQDKNPLGFDFTNAYGKAQDIEIGGINVSEWYTREIDATGTGIRPWDRRHDEPMEAYQAFVCWLYSGVEKGVEHTRRNKAPATGRRTYNAAYKRYLALTDQATGQSLEKMDHYPPVWAKYRVNYEWEKRAAAYDRQDLEEFGEKMALARRDIEEKVGHALLRAMEVCVAKLEDVDLSELSPSAAIYALVQISQELRNFINFQERGKPSLTSVLDMMPDSLRQAVLVAINVDQIVVNRNDGDTVVDSTTRARPPT